VDRRPPHPLLVLAGRARLAHHPLHGEPLYAHALRALTDAVGPGTVVTDDGEVPRVTREVARWQRDTRVVAGDEWWDAVRDDRDRGLIAHDVLCPLVGADFIRSVVDRSRVRPHVSFVGVQAVTDTLKTVIDGTIRGTIDRERVATVTSPVLIAAEVLRARGGGAGQGTLAGPAARGGAGDPPARVARRGGSPGSHPPWTRVVVSQWRKIARSSPRSFAGWRTTARGTLRRKPIGS
jgi:hypothetical protein